MKFLKTYSRILAAGLAISGLMHSVAATEQRSTTDAAGTWKVIHSSTNAQVRPGERILKLKFEGGALSGSLASTSSLNGKQRTYEWPLVDAKLHRNEISFRVTHPPEVGTGAYSTTTYQGRISGDTIKGTLRTEWMGHVLTQSWEAERLKEEKHQLQPQ